MTATFLTGALLLADGAWLPQHGVLIEGGRIAALLPETAQPAATRVALPAGTLLSPGLIDVQVNGGGGHLFNDQPDQATARAIAAAHRRLGTTSILPTLITDTPQAMRAAATVRPEPGILGLHFEGPFLSQARPGVHRQDLIRAPDEADLAFLEALAGRTKTLLTIAPESVPRAQIARLAAAGIILSAGHSAASLECTNEALAAGLAGFTHLFNAMPPLAARAPGIAAAALTHPRSWCGVIADGIHVHPAMLALLLAAKPDRTLLVSDAMPPTGTSATSFQLQGRLVHRAAGALRTADGTLAGADICLADAIRFCVRTLALPAARALTLATAASAAFLGLSASHGRIAPGQQADLLLLTENLDVLGTWLAGAWDGEPGLLAALEAA